MSRAGRVEGKVTIVTGAASGFGRADAERLVAEGGSVVLTDVNVEDGTRAADTLGERALFLEHDVRDEAAWEHVIAETLGHFGRLDALVNNAGVVRVRSIEDTTLDDWRFVVDTSALGTFLGCKHAIPAMKERGGSIVNMSSTAALTGNAPFAAAYSAAKGAIRSLTKTVAAHCLLRDYAIRCNSIHPGGHETGMVAALTKDPGLAANADLLQTVRRERSLGHPEDVAHMVVYLVSDESRRVSGAELLIDAGFLAS